MAKETPKRPFRPFAPFPDLRAMSEFFLSIFGQEARYLLLTGQTRRYRKGEYPWYS